MARRAAMHNFLLMALYFSLNHGAVVAVLNISVLLLGRNGAYQSGALYIAYAVSALAASGGIVEALGPRRSLIAGASLYCVYVLSFPLALVASTAALELTLAIGGGIVGGGAAGLLWVAQGSYFALNAKLYAAENGVELSCANNTLASAFAAIFLLMEVALKLLPLSLDSVGGALRVGAKVIPFKELLVACLFSATAIASVLGLFQIADLRAGDANECARGAGAHVASSDGVSSEEAPQRTDATQAVAAAVERFGATPSGAPSSSASEEPLLPPKSTPCACSSRQLGATVSLWWRRPIIWLLNPIPFTFGVCAALLAIQVTGGLVKSAFGSGAVVAGSLLSMLVALTAGCLQMPFKLVGARLGKPPLMLLGLGGFLSVALLVVLSPDEPPSQPEWPSLLACYLLQGLGRACYEATTKAVYADFFPEDAAAAFSNLVLSNGLSSAAAYFVFPSLSKQAMAATALVCSGVSLASYSSAVLLRQRG